MKNFKMILVSLVGVLLLGAFAIFAVNSVSNKAIALEEQIKVAYSDIKVQEKRRVDLIYNLVDTVKNYDKYEAQTLKDIVDARTNGGDISDVNTLISAVTEAYPDLKSNENYKTLMNELSITENMIAEYRSNYNKQIKGYNRYVKNFLINNF